jgi:hypothetical protein
MDFLDAISPGWVGAIIGFSGILIGTIVAIIVYKISRIKPRLAYQYRASRLISKKGQALPEEVTILFMDKKVEGLVKTHVVFWNSGKSTINGESIVGDDPLRLEFGKKAEILSAHIVAFTRQTNKFTAKINPAASNEVLCSFDYLDEGDGATVEVLNTGEERYPKVLGSIRGIPKGILNCGRISPPPESRVPKFPFRFLKAYSIGVSVIGLLFIAAGLLAPVLDKLSASETETSISTRLAFIIFGLTISAFFSFFLWITRRRFPKSLSIEDTEQQEKKE